ncbi:MAG: hypothetical protein Q7S20_04585 [Gemmatimonadaceae bacterium]|nr:hypothetical protein [Gemmatimonadaceae bacterium]
MTLIVALNKAPSGEALQRTLPVFGLLMTNMADNFAARTPPADLQTVHSQLSTALQGMAGDIVRAGNLMNVNCNQERSMGIGCDELRLKLAGAQRAIGAIGSADNQVTQYRLARARAARMLAEHGVTLPVAP